MDRAKVDLSEPDYTESNQGLHHQIVTRRQMQEHSMIKTDTTLFFFTLSSLLKKHDISEAGSVSIIRQRST
jgi:hypothetical protein